MQLYKQYLEERDGASVIYYDWGFCVYAINADVIYLSELYVIPEHRSSTKAYRLFKEVIALGLQRNCTKILGSYDKTTIGWKRSRDLMIRLKFNFFKKQNNLIYMIRSLHGFR